MNCIIRIEKLIMLDLGIDDVCTSRDRVHSIKLSELGLNLIEGITKR